ncbi:hypothetical protein [Mycolicibacterium conceptionense]|uniref:hypothetical protein n=1 Tax=Mycolicibacterium conceptionense TaxID=451644 RepID=UPI0013F65B91|nr:hypothetical protein [Mycolicibacterium conceptionense]
MTRPGREWMAPPGSGAPMWPGQDCPSCGAALSEAGKHKVCGAGCGHRQAVPQ